MSRRARGNVLLAQPGKAQAHQPTSPPAQPYHNTPQLHSSTVTPLKVLEVSPCLSGNTACLVWSAWRIAEGISRTSQLSTIRFSSAQVLRYETDASCRLYSPALTARSDFINIYLTWDLEPGAGLPSPARNSHQITESRYFQGKKVGREVFKNYEPQPGPA